MPQLHLYVPRDLEDEVRRRAERRGLSVSRYLAELVRRAIADEWPEDFFQEIVGGWDGEPLRRPPQPPLEARAVLERDAGERPD